MAADSRTTKIQVSKTKTFLLILVSLAFVCVSIWLFSIADEQIRRPPIVLKLISIISVCFFGFGFIAGFKKLFDKRPGLIIDDNGIQDNSSISTGRFISWSNITGFKTIKIKSTSILLIYINNAEDIINIESKWKQKIMRYSEKTYGTPLSISSGTLQIKFHELEILLLDKLTAYQARSK